MTERGVESFRDQISRRLDNADASRQHRRDEMEQQMAKLETRQEGFHQIAKHLLADALGPPMREFADHFDNARLVDSELGIRCELRHCLRFPVLARVEFQIAHNETFEEVTAQFRAEILPVFIRYEQGDELRVQADGVDMDALREWVEGKLLRFLDSYLQIETHDQYQQDNLVVDPVCGMKISRPQGLTYEHAGKTYYFCAQRCVDRFAAEPAKYVPASRH